MAKAEGAATFPYMKDPNTGAAMTESDDIVEYLFRKYGPVANGRGAVDEMGAAELGVPMMLQRGGITNLTCYAAAVARLKARNTPGLGVSAQSSILGAQGCYLLRPDRPSDIRTSAKRCMYILFRRSPRCIISFAGKITCSESG
jgi:hypothetical protein